MSFKELRSWGGPMPFAPALRRQDPGKPCRSPALHGKKRCRMHGGTPESGAPRGNTNAQKHGLYRREATTERRQLRELMRQSRRFILKIE